MSTKQKVFVALLRQPHNEKPDEMRSDPFWEFGSFGLTGCHKTNLLHPKKVHELAGARIAFVQGGEVGSKLIYLTPPVVATPLGDRSQISWPVEAMPYRYEHAPVVVSPSGHSDVPEILSIFKDVRRNSWMGRLASKFRTRRLPLPEACAEQIISVWNARKRKATATDLAVLYSDALPYNPPKIDRNRRQTYNNLLAKVTA